MFRAKRGRSFQSAPGWKNRRTIRVTPRTAAPDGSRWARRDSSSTRRERERFHQWATANGVLRFPGALQKAVARQPNERSPASAPHAPDHKSCALLLHLTHQGEALLAGLDQGFAGLSESLSGNQHHSPRLALRIRWPGSAIVGGTAAELRPRRFGPRSRRMCGPGSIAPHAYFSSAAFS